MRRQRAIWLVAGGPMQLPAATEIVARGYKLVVTDVNQNCACASIADEMVICDTFDIPSHLRAAKILSKRFKILAVMTAAADCHGTVAAITHSLHLHGVSAKLSRTCRNKYLTRTALFAAGISQPKFKLVRTLKEAATFLRQIGGSGILKSTDNSGSRGLTVLRDATGLTKDAFGYAQASGTTGCVLVEGLLRPVKDEIAEQSVETIWYNGKMYWLNWVDRLFRKDFLRFEALRDSRIYANTGWGVEIGHINPAIHSLETKETVHRLIEWAGQAIGMHKERGGHVLKADIMLTGDGPIVLELTPRLSGGWDSSGTTISRGANFVGGAISLALGEDFTVDVWYKYFTYRHPELFASILSNITPGAKDCVGRQFALGIAPAREKSVQNALKNLNRKHYVVSME